jgi:DUF3014 family protein
LERRSIRPVADLRDFELSKTDEPFGAERTARSRLWILVVVLGAILLGTGAYFLYTRRVAPAPATVATKPAETEVAVQPLGRDAERVSVPPLDESDALVRELVRKITSNPQVVAWLATSGLIRNFVVVVSNVAEGPTPAKQLRVLRPAAGFAVVDRGGQRFIDPRSYTRYDALADAVASIDPAGGSRLYATLKPRIAEAYGQLGQPPNAFDAALERAIGALLQTPVVDGPIRVETQGGTNYRYADSRLEGLTAAQRHLLRTGPRNVRTIQSALRRIAAALGIPPGRLPVAR